MTLSKHLIVSDRLPTNGNLLIGYEVPHWQAAVSLSLEAAAIFKSLKCIGWDIAVTEQGPFLIEGNVFWNPMTLLEGRMRPMWRKIEAMITEDPAPTRTQDSSSLA